MGEYINLRRSWWSFASLSISLYVVVLNAASLNTAMTHIARDLHASMSALGWIFSAYMLTTCALVVLGGHLGDEFGRRKVYFFGILFFSIGTFFAAVAQTMWLLIIARIVQGIGSALIVPATTAITEVIFPKKLRKHAFAIWGAMTGLGFATGPIFGAFFAQTVGWRFIFWLNIALIAIAFMIALVAMPESHSPKRDRLDFLGVILLSLGSFSLVITLDYSLQWRSEFIFAGLLLSLFAFMVLYVVESHLKFPLIHTALLKKSKFTAGILCSLVFYMSLYVFYYQINMYILNPHGLNLSAIRAGFFMLPASLAFFIVSLGVYKLQQRFSSLRLSLGGFFLIALGACVLGFLNISWGVVGLMAPTILIGAGFGALVSPSLELMILSVPEEHAGEASGVANIVKYFASAVGIAASNALYSFVSVEDLQITAEKMHLSKPKEQVVRELLTGTLSDLEQPKNVLMEVQTILHAGFSSTMFLIVAMCIMVAAIGWLHFSKPKK